MARRPPTPEARDRRRRLVALAMTAVLLVAIVLALLAGIRFGASGA